MNADIAGLLDGLSAVEATVVLVGGALVASVLLATVGLSLIHRVVEHTDSRFDDILFEELRLPIVATVFLAGVFLLSETPAVAAGRLDSQQVDQFLGKPALSVIVVVWAWALNRIVNRTVATIQESGRQYDFAPVFSNVWTLVVTVTAGFFLLSLWNIDVTPLLGAAGIAGIAIGFAAKDTVANFFGGMALYFDDTYKLGDYVVLETGEAGTVVKVGIRSTTLLTRSEVLVTVPNAMLNAGMITNQSAPKRRKRITVPVGVAYGTDVDAFEELLLEVTGAEELVLDSPTPRVRLRKLGDYALEYELLCWVPAPTRAAKATHRLNRAIYVALGEAGIEIPFPRQDLAVRSLPAVAAEEADHDAAVR